MVDDKTVPSSSDAGEQSKNDRGDTFFGVIGDVAKAAWNSVRELEDRIVNGSSRKPDGSEELPTVAVATDDKGSNKLWEFFGNASTDIGSRPRTDALDSLAADKLITPQNKALEQQPVSFLDRAWNFLFPEPNKYERDKKDGDGNPTKTEWGPKGVDHTTVSGKTHVDGKGAFHLEANGDQAAMDRTTKSLSEKGAHGTYAVMDESGKFAIADGYGNKLEWQDGKLMAVARDGSSTQVTDERVIRRFQHTQWRVEQSRHPDQKHQEGQEGPSVQTVADDSTKGNQMVVVDDGKGTIVKIHQDGSKEIVVGKGDDQVTFMTKPGSREVLAVKGNELYVLRPGAEPGEWDAYDVEGNKIGSVENVLGQHCKHNDAGGLRLSNSTQITGDGTIQTASEQGQQVQIGNDSNTAVVKDAGGSGQDVKVTAKGGTSSVESSDSAGTTTSTTVDTTGGGVKQDAITAAGQRISLFNLDPLSLNYLTIGTADGDVTAARDGRGHEQIRLWNGDLIDALDHTLRLHDGTLFDADKGNVKFADGTWINALGLIFDGDVRIGGVGEYWPEEIEQNQAEAQALASQAEALAAAIAAKPGDATLSDIGQLLALYSQLGGLKAMAASLGDFSSISRLDSGIAATDAAIQDARIQVAQQQILTALGGLSPDLLAQAHNMMPGSVSFEGLQKMLAQRGVTTAKAET